MLVMSQNGRIVLKEETITKYKREETFDEYSGE